ncbi:MAG: GxxExxY protein [Verrucomicrobiota bacterium]
MGGLAVLSFAGLLFFMSESYLSDEGYSLIGAAFEVHGELGRGLSEEIYQESLEWELGLRKIVYQSKAELKVFYKGHLLNKRYIPDLQVCGEILVELKAVKELNSEHEQQLLNYMYITRKAVGYLINFAPPSLKWKRFILEQYVPKE